MKRGCLSRDGHHRHLFQAPVPPLLCTLLIDRHIDRQNIAGTPPWYETYTDLIRRIERYIAHTKEAATHYDLILHDYIGVLSLQANTIIGLTALTNMHSALVNALAPDNSLSQRQAVNAIVELVSISENFRKEDYEFIDATLSVSSLRALPSLFLVSRLAYFPLFLYTNWYAIPAWST